MPDCAFNIFRHENGSLLRHGITERIIFRIFHAVILSARTIRGQIAHILDKGHAGFAKASPLSLE